MEGSPRDDGDSGMDIYTADEQFGRGRRRADPGQGGKPGLAQRQHQPARFC